MNMTRITTWVATATCTLLMATQAMAFDGKHREIDWEDKLDLTDAQEEKIDAIEDRYHDKFRELRKGDARPGDKHDEMEALMQQMRGEIHDVLTDEQRQQAKDMMREQHAKMQRKHAKRLARDLDLSDEQKDKLMTTLSALKSDYEWPLDKAQRDEAHDAFDAAVNSVLDDEQKQKWEKMKEKQKRKWHHPEERGDGHKGKHHDDDDE
ncbi:Spy/CpxP family protein refolding chaperone [Thalassolituus marinus]|uniref:Zinc resistance-associated protein n=1 Tax=Thalassolituus marinus TaxID=671053 RepID=A0ABS7ZSL9_9GAMM|nr:Spy/CpxP family protein refolding chaperone [Thalassolituus marinus]MCA6064142.1 hypothetical protein [Thalassolituus marinus]